MGFLKKLSGFQFGDKNREKYTSLTAENEAKIWLDLKQRAEKSRDYYSFQIECKNIVILSKSLIKVDFTIKNTSNNAFKIQIEDISIVDHS